VIAPEAKTLQAPSGVGKVQRSVTQAPGHFTLDESLETTPGIVSPGDYPALRALESGLREASSSLFLVRKPDQTPASSASAK